MTDVAFAPLRTILAHVWSLLCARHCRRARTSRSGSTTDGTLKLAPVFVDKGDEVVFATHEAPNLVAIVRLKLSDGSRRRLHPTVVNHQFDPAFSRDGRFHAYARSATSPQMVLVIQDLAREEGIGLSTARIARDRAQSLVRARRLARRLQPFGCRRPSDQLGEHAGTGPEAT